LEQEHVMGDLETLVCDARGGDLAAFAVRVRRFQDMAVAYAYSLLGDFHGAEDVAQTAFLDAYRRLGQLKEPAAFPVWLSRVVFKHCDRLSRRKTQRKDDGCVARRSTRTAPIEG